MNIYEKLQNCKSELQSAELKKTGENSFSHYSYWELADFMPMVISLFLKHKLCSFVSFGSDLAVLTVINAEAPEESIIVTSPMAAAELKGCHPIQNMGAVETYSRRYLYSALLDITESDAIDATTGKAEPPKAEPKKEQKAEPKKEPEPPKESVVCADCGKPISGGKKSDGTHMTAAEVATQTNGLCMACYKAKS